MSVFVQAQGIKTVHVVIECPPNNCFDTLQCTYSWKKKIKYKRKSFLEHFFKIDTYAIHFRRQKKGLMFYNE